MFIEGECYESRIVKIQALKISRSYAWHKRRLNGRGTKKQEFKAKIRGIHEIANKTPGSLEIIVEVNKRFRRPH